MLPFCGICSGAVVELGVRTSYERMAAAARRRNVRVPGVHASLLEQFAELRAGFLCVFERGSLAHRPVWRRLLTRPAAYFGCSGRSMCELDFREVV